MGRMLEPTQAQLKQNTFLAMDFLNVHLVAQHYNNSKEGLTVNDGRFVTYIDDGEEDFSPSNEIYW